jgi:hypothetical protein
MNPPPTQITAATTWTDLKNVYQVMGRFTASAGQAQTRAGRGDLRIARESRKCLWLAWPEPARLTRLLPHEKQLMF